MREKRRRRPVTDPEMTDPETPSDDLEPEAQPPEPPPRIHDALERARAVAEDPSAMDAFTRSDLGLILERLRELQVLAGVATEGESVSPIEAINLADRAIQNHAAHVLGVLGWLVKRQVMVERMLVEAGVPAAAARATRAQARIEAEVARDLVRDAEGAGDGR
jgi:hypothetical protein